jgi:hypothetical protein
MPTVMREVLAAALPWPKTLAEAAAELAWWNERDREIEAAWGGDTGDTCLSIACYARRQMIEDALAYDLPALDVADLVHRQRHSIQCGWHDEKIDAAVLRDLERLAGESVQYGQHNMGRSTATERRAAALAMLADPTLAHLSDRELARRARVSPSTIGNLRRRAAQRELAL